MTMLDERAHASLVLQLLLDAAPAADTPIAWGMLLPLARRNGVLIRVAERLGALGIDPPPAFADGVARERQRVREAFALVDRVGTLCRARGIAFLFAKACQHYPDLGDDLDLLVLAPAARVDTLLAHELPATAQPRDVGGWLAGTVAFRVRGVATALDVQHERIGTAGEHRAYAVTLVRRQRRVVVDGIECAAPTPEDQLVLQGVQRVCGRRSIRLCDVVYTAAAIRRDTLDWDYVLATARRIGVLSGLGCYLSYVEQIQRDVCATPLLPAAARRALPLGGWGRALFTDGAYRFPALRANGKIYVRQLAAGLRTANWGGAARLCCVPVVGAATAVRHLTTRWTRATEWA